MSKPVGGPFYPVVDRGKIPTDLLKLAQNKRLMLQNVRGFATGEMRPPKAGEWFLSGADVETYYTKVDLDTPYYIARLVLTRTETTERIVSE